MLTDVDSTPVTYHRLLKRHGRFEACAAKETGGTMHRLTGLQPPQTEMDYVKNWAEPRHEVIVEMRKNTAVYRNSKRLPSTLGYTTLMTKRTLSKVSAMTYPLHLQAYPPALRQRVSFSLDRPISSTTERYSGTISPERRTKVLSTFDYNADIERARSW